MIRKSDFVIKNTHGIKNITHLLIQWYKGGHRKRFLTRQHSGEIKAYLDILSANIAQVAHIQAKISLQYRQFLHSDVIFVSLSSAHFKQRSLLDR